METKHLKKIKFFLPFQRGRPKKAESYFAEENFEEVDDYFETAQQQPQLQPPLTHTQPQPQQQPQQQQQQLRPQLLEQRTVGHPQTGPRPVQKIVRPPQPAQIPQRRPSDEGHPIRGQQPMRQRPGPPGPVRAVGVGEVSPRRVMMPGAAGGSGVDISKLGKKLGGQISITSSEIRRPPPPPPAPSSNVQTFRPEIGSHHQHPVHNFRQEMGVQLPQRAPQTRPPLQQMSSLEVKQEPLEEDEEFLDDEEDLGEEDDFGDDGELDDDDEMEFHDDDVENVE